MPCSLARIVCWVHLLKLARMYMDLATSSRSSECSDRGYGKSVQKYATTTPSVTMASR